MIKTDINVNENKFEVCAGGTIMELSADIITLLRMMYQNISGEDMKKMFLMHIKQAIEEEVFTKTPEEIMKLSMKHIENALKKKDESNKSKQAMKEELDNLLKNKLNKLKDNGQDEEKWNCLQVW